MSRARGAASWRRRPIALVPGFPVAALAAFAALAALVLAGCAVARTVSVGQLPDKPFSDEAVEPIVKVVDAAGPRGQYRAWVYRTRTGNWCFDVATADAGSGSCGSDVTALLGFGQGNEAQTGITLTGGTRKPGATSAVVTLKGGGTQTSALLRPGAFVPGDVRLFVIMLPVNVDFERVDITDGAGTVLETFTRS